MGTTDTALRTGSGQFGFVLVIQGFSHVITDSADIPAVVTAYAATSWLAALGGLKVVGSIKQSIEPLKHDLDIPTLTFQIMDFDGSDTLGKALWKSKPTISSRLDATFAPAANGSGVVVVKDNTGMPTSGTVYLGNRAITYSAKTGSTGLTIPVGGASALNPFEANGSNIYSWPQNSADGWNGDVAAPPRVANVPQTWIGKHVALYVHRIAGGVWDSRAQAHLEFAGTITRIEDGDGITSIQCQDMRRKIEDAVLLRKQFIGYVKEGIYLVAGDKVRAKEYIHYPTELTKTTATDFTVVASGASGVSQCNEGLYKYDDFISLLNAWVSADANLLGDWAAYKPIRQDIGYRTVFRARFGTAVSRSTAILSNATHIMEFMGFPDWALSETEDGFAYAASPARIDAEVFITSTQAPYRIRVLQATNGGMNGRKVEFESNDGTWYNHSGYLPNGLREKADGENWSYITIGDSDLAVAKYESSTLLSSVSPVQGFGKIVVGRLESSGGVTWDDPPSTRLPVRQLVYLAGKFSELIPMLIASIGGTTGVNHATYDILPWGAGVPWALLGSTFLTSCDSLESAGHTDTIAIRLDKPTRLKDVLIPELALRFAFLVFKDGVYQFVSPPVPNALAATHALSEENKAVPSGSDVPTSESQVSSDWMVNVIKINYERDAAGKFVGHPITIKDQVSIDLHGETGAVTIDAVNSVSETTGISGSTVEQLASNLTTLLFPMFGRPVKTVTRTIAPTLYHMTPGDTVTLSDDLVRDPTSGARGISNRAGICISSVHDYGHEGGELMGEATILLTDEDRTYPLSPAAEIDATYTSGLYTNGYDSTNFRLKLKDHAFSRATGSNDVTHFDNSDKVRIVELDPANPASPDAWDRTLASTGGVDTATGYLQMTAALSSPSHSGSKKYVVVPQSYASVQTSQKLHVFQADDLDGMIQNVSEENTYGASNELDFGRGVATDLPALIPTERGGDGKPVTPYELQYLTRMANNLVGYKTATHVPFTLSTAAYTTTTAYRLELVLLFWFGGHQVASRSRKISIAPQMKIATAGNTATVRVTTSRYPPGGVSTTNATFAGTTRSVIFTTTSDTYVIPTAQDLLPIPSTIPGFTWISIEMKTSSNSHACTCKGLPTLYLKPVT